MTEAKKKSNEANSMTGASQLTALPIKELGYESTKSNSKTLYASDTADGHFKDFRQNVFVELASTFFTCTLVQEGRLFHAFVIMKLVI